MATKKDRSTDEDISGINGASVNGMPQTSMDDDESYSFELSEDLDKTTLDLDAFAPYTPSPASNDPRVPAPIAPTVSPDQKDEELRLHNASASDEAPDFSSYAFDMADAVNGSLENESSFDEVGFETGAPGGASSILSSEPPSHGLSRLFIQIGKFSAWHDLVGKDLEVGRPDESGLHDPDISLDFDDAVSRKHGRIFVDGFDHYYEDTGSTNGSLVNNVLVSPHSPKRLADGDVIRVGYQTEITYYK